MEVSPCCGQTISNFRRCVKCGEYIEPMPEVGVFNRGVPRHLIEHAARDIAVHVALREGLRQVQFVIANNGAHRFDLSRGTIGAWVEQAKKALDE